jgi:hypothetical protein
MKLKQIITNYWERIDRLLRSSAGKNRISPTTSSSLALPETLVACLDEQIVTSIGDFYKRTYPTETPLDWSELAAESGASSINSLSMKQRRRLLHQRIKEDFTKGRIVQLQGWLLSKTEARQCALFAKRGDD